MAAAARKYKGGGGRYCSACRNTKGEFYAHGIFQIPVCETCDLNYHEGEFIIEDGNEIFCRWCGQGEEGNLFLCDTCPKSFCIRCVRTNFGIGEIERIKNLSDRWCCFVCSPQSFRDLCVKHGWKGITQEASDTMARRSRQAGIVNYDISRGREKFEIPAVNTVDDEPAPTLFIYVNKPVAGEGTKLTNNPNFLSCCSCTDNCSDPLTCECMINSGGPSYDHTGRLLVDRPAGIYECNYRCSCNVQLCKNRVVSNGPSQRLEVFRCADPKKGWGVRCKDPLPSGTFVSAYLGEIMAESEADQRGLSVCDEYLYSLDCWGRSQACQRLNELGLKRSLESRPREYFVDTHNLTKAKVEKLFDDTKEDKEFVDFLARKGKFDNMGRLRNHIDKYAPWVFLHATGELDNASILALSQPNENLQHNKHQPNISKVGHGKSVLKNTGVAAQASSTGSSRTSTSSKDHKSGGGKNSLQVLLSSLDALSAITNNANSDASTSSNSNIASNNCGTTTITNRENFDTTDDNDSNNGRALGNRAHQVSIDLGDKQPNKKSKTSSTSTLIQTKMGNGKNKISKSSDSSDVSIIDELKEQNISWYDTRLVLRQRAWNDARSIIVDRCINEADEKDESFIIDARWYGGVGRFLNHSCAPNLDKILVYCDTHDVTIPRVAFFTNDFIPANTELCYDYGYFAGNVAGRHRDCLCGAEGCRKTWY